MKYLKTLFEDRNGDPDEITFAAVIALMVLCAIGVIGALHGKDINLQDFGLGAAAIVGAVGGGKWARDGRPKGE